MDDPRRLQSLGYQQCGIRGCFGRAATRVVLSAILLLPGCAGPRCRVDVDPVACQLESRLALGAESQFPADLDATPGEIDGVVELTEDQAITIALANNAAFQSLRTQLSMAYGDVIQAQLLTNPNLVNFVPVGVKQWEWTLYAPLEAFLLRPQRVAATRLEYQRIAHQIVQGGLTLVRDTRVAYADAALAQAQAELAEEATSLRDDIHRVTQSQLRSGEISEVESTAARVDALNARAARSIAEQTTIVTGARLASLLGLPEEDARPRVALGGLRPAPAEDENTLIALALASRPDMHAACWAVRAAEQRAELARKQFWKFDGVVDANGKGAKGYEVGPGLRFDIPIFNRNQGGVIRADAELRQARLNYRALHDQIVQEVRISLAQLRQAAEVAMLLRSETVPVLEEALGLATKGFADGGTTYLQLLQTTTQYLDAKARLLDQTASVNRGWAELERAVGRRWQGPVLDLPPEPETSLELERGATP